MRRVSLVIAVLGAVLSVSASAADFGFKDVIARAKALAQKPYQAPQPVPKFLRDLSFNDYQGIRFKPKKSLWQATGSRFQVMLVSPGLYYTHAVKMHVVNRSGVHPVPYHKDDFSYADPDLARRIPADLGFAGFKLTYPLRKAGVQNQFLVFAGASYFRGVGRDNTFGISARGIAVDTGLASGEQFPSFVEYWLERPAPDAHAMTFYALLNGKSVTGAYQFAVYPGRSTVVRVRAALFARDPIKLLGIAPLTSMFYYGENTPRPPGEWRPQVHDSDGLLIHNGGSGEWLWRPLVNPKTLQANYFETSNVKGFGLLQRHTEFHDYQDLGARYDQRPSAWVETDGDWGKGHVVLVELPSAQETNDNMVAFWSPDQTPPSGQPLDLSYSVRFGDSDVSSEPMGHAVNTFVGDGNRIGGGNVKGAYRVIVDFAGKPLDRLSPKASVVGTVSAQQGGEVLEHYVEYLAPLHRWRLSILAKPADGKPLALRAFLSEGDRTLTETWNYSLPADNDVLKTGGGS
ncbi:MAG: glucan biosynthesis protein G [Gammaproteobacteria bacterium]